VKLVIYLENTRSDLKKIPGVRKLGVLKFLYGAHLSTKTFFVAHLSVTNLENRSLEC